MHHSPRLDFTLFLATLLWIGPAVTWAESGVLVIRVKDVHRQPIAGLQIGVEGDGGSATTGDDGKARIALAKDTKENSWVSLQILKSPRGKDMVMVSPWDYKTTVPSFKNESGNVVEVVVVQRGDRSALENNTFAKAVAQKINKANALKIDKQLDSQASLTAVAKLYGLSSIDIDKAIRAWGSSARDPYESGIAALYAQNYQKASAELGESLKQREANLISNQKAVADAAGFLGASLYLEGKYRDSAVAYQRYLQLRPDDMGSTSDLGLSLLLAGDYAAAEFPLRRAVSGVENSPAPDNKLLVFGLNNLASLPRVMGQDAEAEALFRRALNIAQKTLSPDDEAVATTMNNLAVCLKTEGKFDEAEELYRQAVEIDKRVSGPNSVNAANSQYNLGRLLLAKGDYVRAEPLFRRALEIVEQTLPPNHPYLAECLNGVGSVLEAEGHVTEAESFYRRGLEIDEKTLGRDHPRVAIDLMSIASLLVHERIYVEAKLLCQRAVDIYETRLGRDHPDTALALNNLATVLGASGDYNGAEPLLERALEIDEKTLGPHNLRTEQIRTNIALLQREMSLQKP
jgi:tetratricopeptide (TPR) repeat protein